MCNNGTRGVVEIAIQHKAKLSAVWPIETAYVYTFHAQSNVVRSYLLWLLFRSAG